MPPAAVTFSDPIVRSVSLQCHGRLSQVQLSPEVGCAANNTCPCHALNVLTIANLHCQHQQLILGKVLMSIQLWLLDLHQQDA